MLAYFPSPYKDELFYSVISRYFAHSGFPSYNIVLGKLMKNSYTRVDFEFGTIGLNEEMRQFLQKDYDLKSIVLEHTMLPVYSKFASEIQRAEAIEVLCTGEGDIRSCLPFPMNKSGKRYMRYCPECAKADREEFGETYWHRNHQIRGIDACPIHKCRLCNTAIELNAKKMLRLYIAEDEVVDTVAVQAKEIDIKLAEYATKLLQIDMPENHPNIGEWLVSKLEGTTYISARGKRKYMSRMYDDIIKFYVDLSEPIFTRQHQLQKVFMGYSYDFMQVCQLSLFLGILVDEFSKMELPERSITERFNKKVEQLYQEGLGCHRIARKVGSCPSTALKANRIVEKAPHDYAVRKGMTRQDWKAMDEEMLPKVKELCEKIYTGDGGRPKRVTAFAITREMEWPDKRLEYLPKCKKLIHEYSMETIEEYWARESVWAYEVLQKEYSVISWRKLRDMTNMRRENFECCKKYLSDYTDDITAEMIRILI